jgi:hypothetical protein
MPASPMVNVTDLAAFMLSHRPAENPDIDAKTGLA